VERRTLGYAAAVAAVFELIVAGALALGGGEEEPRGKASPTATAADSGTGWGRAPWATSSTPATADSGSMRRVSTDP
jgi:hypothetical protein